MIIQSGASRMINPGIACARPSATRAFMVLSASDAVVGVGHPLQDCAISAPSTRESAPGLRVTPRGGDRLEPAEPVREVPHGRQFFSAVWVLSGFACHGPGLGRRPSMLTFLAHAAEIRHQAWLLLRLGGLPASGSADTVRGLHPADRLYHERRAMRLEHLQPCRRHDRSPGFRSVRRPRAAATLVDVRTRLAGATSVPAGLPDLDAVSLAWISWRGSACRADRGAAGRNPRKAPANPRRRGGVTGFAEGARPRICASSPSG